MYYRKLYTATPVSQYNYTTYFCTIDYTLHHLRYLKDKDKGLFTYYRFICSKTTDKMHNMEGLTNVRNLLYWWSDF